MQISKVNYYLIYIMLFVLALYVAGCSKSEQKLEFKTEYQAVFLDNGQAFFGKVEGAGSPYPVLREAYYVQSQVSKENNQVTGILIKRGKEWHAPDMMYLNARHIILIEPVSPDSRVAQLISEAKTQKDEGTK